MRIRLGLLMLAVGLLLGGAARAEVDAFDADQFLDRRGAETLASIAADLSAPAAAESVVGAEPAGGADQPLATAALDRTEPAEEQAVAALDVTAPTETGTVEAVVSHDGQTSPEPVGEATSVPVESVGSVTGSVLVGATAAESADPLVEIAETTPIEVEALVEASEAAHVPEEVGARP